MNAASLKALNNARRASAGLPPAASGMGSRTGSNASLASKNTGSTYSYERLINQHNWPGGKPRNTVGAKVTGFFKNMFDPTKTLGGGRRRASRKVRKTKHRKTRRR